jgi:hypothetical protein
MSRIINVIFFLMWLTVILAVMKVIGSINLSWWVVFLPCWLPIVCIIGLFVVIYGAVYISILVNAWRND